MADRATAIRRMYHQLPSHAQMTETHFQCECCAPDWAATWMDLPFQLIGSCIIRSPLGFGTAVCDSCDNQARVLICLRDNYHQRPNQ